MNQSELSLDTLLQETLALTEYLRVSTIKPSNDVDYLFDLADSIVSEENDLEATGGEIAPTEILQIYPESPGIIYKIDNGSSTFCVRGFSSSNIRLSFEELTERDSVKRIVLKLGTEDSNSQVQFFVTKSFELAEAVRDQIINRRFPHQEDALCNLSDPGFSWWMNTDLPYGFEIFFRSHGINRAEKYIQLGPIGDGGVAALRMNQARSLLRSSFPISEFSCDDKSFTVASLKPEHLSFISFKNIFLEGINNTELENFPDNSVGRTLYYYFQELAVVRKFWIEVKTKLS
jgi:hypothetical protein